jgi:hypothetical protein
VRHAADYGVMRDPVYVDMPAAESFNNLFASLHSQSIVEKGFDDGDDSGEGGRRPTQGGGDGS